MDNPEAMARMPMSVTGISTSRPMHGSARHQPARAAGFTLLELLVVVFIIGIMATMFTLSVGVAGGTDRELRRETERFQTLLGLALEDASFQARELGLRLYPRSYEFSVLDRGENREDPVDDTWVPISDDVLGRRELPGVFVLELEIEGRAVNLERSEKDVAKKYEPQLFMFSSGDISDSFTIRLRSLEEDRSYSLDVGIDGATSITRDDG